MISIYTRVYVFKIILIFSRNSRFTYQIMSVRSPLIAFSFTIYNLSKLKGRIYSPIFSSNDNVFWQLCIEYETKEKDDYYNIFITPVAGSGECYWNERSELIIQIKVDEIRGKGKASKVYRLYENDVKTNSADSDIEEAIGPIKAFKKSSLQDGTIIIGVNIITICSLSERCLNVNSFNSIPRSLTDAWRDHMIQYKVDDVEFDVNGRKFYVCSSILTKRSNYFQKMFSGQWSEISNVQNKKQSIHDSQIDINTSMVEDNSSILSNENERDNESQTDLEKNTIKYHIEVSDCDSRIFNEMLSYLYTNQIHWMDEDFNSMAIALFCLADKYLLSDLRQRAKHQIIEELSITNIANIMFGLVPKYNDLKKPVLNYMVANFKEVSKTQGFKSILANPIEYPSFDEIMSEVLEGYFKTQER